MIAPSIMGETFLYSELFLHFESFRVALAFKGQSGSQPVSIKNVQIEYIVSHSENTCFGSVAPPMKESSASLQQPVSVNSYFARVFSV